MDELRKMKELAVLLESHSAYRSGRIGLGNNYQDFMKYTIKQVKKLPDKYLDMMVMQLINLLELYVDESGETRIWE